MLFIGLLIVVVVSGIFLLVDRICYSAKRINKSLFVYSVEVLFVLATIYLMVQWVNFEFALFATVVISGVVCLLDKLWLSKRRAVRSAALIAAQGEELTDQQQSYLKELPTLIEFSRSFFGVLLLVLVIRSCLFSPFRIPSGSLEPTLAVGDFILVSKFSYGVRIPVINKTVIPVGEPERGDIVVVHWPPKERVDYIKRVVGVPGDHLRYVNRTLYINGEEAKQTVYRSFNYQLPNGDSVSAEERTEDLTGVKHHLYVFPRYNSADYTDIVVPDGMYFLMGDNRDDSQDSRYWGFVTEDQLVGKAEYVVMSWNSRDKGFRWDRFFKRIQ